MNQRTAQILEAAVGGFIDIGEPVSSGWLYKRHNFGIRPAMIRLELEELSREGYLEQPHHSAGRVPTNSGYEFFAEMALEATPANYRGGFRPLFNRRAWPEILGEISEELGLLSVATDFSNLYKIGLENLMENLEWETPEEVNSVIHDFVEIDNRVKELAKKANGEKGPEVFVGKKSPVTKSENLSVVAKTQRTRDGYVSLLVIGPKRMDYKKTLKIFQRL